MPKAKKLSKGDLDKLGSLNNEQTFLPETVKIGDISLEMHPQSPMVVYDFMSILTRTITTSEEMKAIVSRFFPQLEEVYSCLSYTSLMEVLGLIATSILSSEQKQDLQERLEEKEVV